MRWESDIPSSRCPPGNAIIAATQVTWPDRDGIRFQVYGLGTDFSSSYCIWSDSYPKKAVFVGQARFLIEQLGRRQV